MKNMRVLEAIINLIVHSYYKMIDFLNWSKLIFYRRKENKNDRKIQIYLQYYKHEMESVCLSSNYAK